LHPTHSIALPSPRSCYSTSYSTHHECDVLEPIPGFVCDRFIGLRLARGRICPLPILHHIQPATQCIYGGLRAWPSSVERWLPQQRRAQSKRVCGHFISCGSHRMLAKVLYKVTRPACRRNIFRIRSNRLRLKKCQNSYGPGGELRQRRVAIFTVLFTAPAVNSRDISARGPGDQGRCCIGARVQAYVQPRLQHSAANRWLHAMNR
jgi:hypothetical protein